jgi:hypothetical protein
MKYLQALTAGNMEIDKMNENKFNILRGAFGYGYILPRIPLKNKNISKKTLSKRFEGEELCTIIERENYKLYRK